MQDPELVISRTVQPRIAYRGLPAQDNPVRNSAILFPAHVFHRTLDNALGDAMDSELGPPPARPAVCWTSPMA